MAQHLSKEELQSDALLSYYAQSALYFRQNRTKVIGVLVAIAVVIAAVIGYSLYMNKQEQRAQVALGKAERFITSQEWAKGLNGDDVENVAGFKAIADNYGGTDAGNLAAYYAAVCAVNLGENETALTYIRKHNPPSDVIGIGAITLNAVIEANAGNNKTAGDLYRKAADLVKSDTNTPQHLLLAAQHYLAASANTEAKNAAQRIIDEYPDSPAANEARKIAGRLS